MLFVKTEKARYISELLVIGGCLLQLFFQAKEIIAQGFLYYLSNLVSRLLFFGFILRN
jgi:hypothetical protein